ncbi:hypothetical protein C5167_035753 [Papaver somniferum]|nr:hypothetical protein C5167_035753 [Papaver somniferum]
MSQSVAGVDNTFRKKFDREDYEERARERERQEEEDSWKSKFKGPPVQRQPLKRRDYEVDLDSRLGFRELLGPHKWEKASKSSGYVDASRKGISSTGSRKVRSFEET